MAESKREAMEIMAQKEIEKGRILTERASEGDINGVKEILSSGMHPNADAYNRTLYYKSKNYWSPLHHATWKGCHEIAKLLIEYGGAMLEL